MPVLDDEAAPRTRRRPAQIRALRLWSLLLVPLFVLLLALTHTALRPTQVTLGDYVLMVTGKSLPRPLKWPTLHHRAQAVPGGGSSGFRFSANRTIHFYYVDVGSYSYGWVWYKGLLH